MSLNSLGIGRPARRWLPKSLLTLLCLAGLLLGLFHWLEARQNQDLSFLLPIYQNGQELQPAAIISEDGQVLLPVRAIAENNGWQCQSSEISAEAEASNGQAKLWGGSLLLVQPESGGTIAVCWFGAADEGLPASLGVWCNGQPLAISSLGRIYKQQLYLPEDFFAAALGLELKLDENGKANLLQPQPQA